MTKSEILTLFENQYELAETLGITRQAVEQWPADKDIPQKQYLRLRYELMPESFKKDGTLRQARA